MLSNVAPRKAHDICQLWFEGKTKESLALQMEMLPLCSALFCDVNPIPVKAAMNLLGYKAGPCRMPLGELAADKVELLRTQLQQHGLL